MGLNDIRTDYTENASKYVGSVDQSKLDSIIKFCGIALKGKDSQFVSMTDDAEIKRVCDSFGSKKLGLSEEQTRAGLKKVHEAMKAEHSKMRTTVYYLLAQHTGTLDKL
jgi:hypothetical protein